MAEITNLANIANVASMVYNTAKLEVADPEIKAVELTTLLKTLLSVGIYDSVDSAQKDGIPGGTFIIVDDPNTPETEFTIEIVPMYYMESEEALRQQAELAKKLEAAKAAPLDAKPSE